MTPFRWLQRAMPLSSAFALLVQPLGAQAGSPTAEEIRRWPPVIFVHGNGDHAGLWDNTLWRFESNDYPAARLFTIDLPAPVATATANAREANRSTPAEQTAALAAFVARVRRETGAARVALVGSSRGGLTIRQFVRFGGGAAVVSHVITCGTPNHGVFALAAVQPESEFNGQSPYLRALNEGAEVVDGVRYLTLRSDSLDKYAQPLGGALGMPGVAIGVDASGPALRGATNVVLPGTDHREVAFGSAAFTEQFRFLTGRIPRTDGILGVARPRLSGMVSGHAQGAPTNVGVRGARVTVHEVDAASGRRTAAAVYRVTTGASGRWGPFVARAGVHYEFEVAAPDSSVILHVYRAPFPRSSRVVNLRLPAPAPATGDSVSVLVQRPRGYFGASRDTVTLNGQPARGIPPGVPTVDRVLWWAPADSARTVRAVFNGDTLVARTHPADRRRLVALEFPRE